jgi:phosphate transport system substrate-binding protein
MKNYRIFAIGALAAILGATTLTGCGTSDPGAGNGGSGSGSTALNIDGSSTVGPIMQAAVEEFSNTNTNVKPTVGISGTGGGFKKFSAGEIDIADASRPIEEKEIEACKAKGIEFIELPIAFDGLSVVVNPKNTFADTLTVAELKKIWEPDSKVKTWADVRAGFPAQEIKLYGAGTDSGTFDYFTKAIVGKEKASRSNYQASEDDNTLVQGVAGDEFSLGYFGYAYFSENKDKLKLVKIDNGTGGIAPSPETIGDGTYQPLSRPLFIYINKKALTDKPAIKEFVTFLLTEGRELISKVGYVPLGDDDYKAVLDRLEKMQTGTSFRGAETGIRIKDILSRTSVK